MLVMAIEKKLCFKSVHRKSRSIGFCVDSVVGVLFLELNELSPQVRQSAL